MILYPNYYCDKVTDISIELLEKNNIRGIILDVDNTLIDYDRVLLDGVEEWINTVKSAGVKCIILSNSNKLDKVKKVAETLNIDYIYFAKKPLKGGFKRAKEKLNLENSEIAVVGDQIFTDIIGANRSKMFGILVNPIAKKDIWITRLKRPLEEMVVKSYVKKRKKKKE